MLLLLANHIIFKTWRRSFKAFLNDKKNNPKVRVFEKFSQMERSNELEELNLFLVANVWSTLSLTKTYTWNFRFLILAEPDNLMLLWLTLCALVNSFQKHFLKWWVSQVASYLTRTLRAPRGVTRMAGAKAYAVKLAASPITTDSSKVKMKKNI